MNIDKAMQDLETGYANPYVSIQKVSIPHDQLKMYGLRKPRGQDSTSYPAWWLCYGEAGPDASNKVHVYAWKLKDAINEGLVKKGVRSDGADGSA